MEFHIQKSPDNDSAQPYIFNPDDLADIPHPDDFYDENSPQEDIDLPLPPGTSGDDFALSIQYKQPSVKNSNNESLEKSSNVDPGLMSESFNILPLKECIEKPGFEGSELENDTGNKPMDIVDDKYSPSKMDSDEDNQDCVTSKPKVLGKEQAKKRLMAFSLSKQSGASVKKQNKAVTPAKNKEKPPNPNKGTNFQEQFRATISAIEEEKKKMFQNMPNYLLHDMNDLAKSHSLSSSSLQLMEKLKSERSSSKSKNSSSRDGRYSKRSHESTRSRKSYGKNRSRSSSSSKSKKRRRSRSKRRSRSNSKSSRSRRRNRSRSRSRSRRSRSPSKRRKGEKNYKPHNKERQSGSKNKSPEDWNRYKSASSNPENTSKSDTKLRQNEQNRRSRTPNNWTDIKPIFNYLNKGCNAMSSLQARPADPKNSNPALFSEKTIKFTRTKPILCWAENPLHATEYYMSKEMLLENCDQATASILLSIIENKNVGALDEQSEPRHTKCRPWYPRDDYLMNINKDVESNESNLFKSSYVDSALEKEGAADSKKDVNGIKEEAKKRRASLERKISLVNDSYLSDEEDQVKEVILGEVKVQLDLDKNRMKVRSKWDSDYEGETSEKESGSGVVESRDKSTLSVQTQESSSHVKDKRTEGFNFTPDSEKLPEKKKLGTANLSNLNVTESSNANLKSDETSGNLLSEYEEFLKMVSVDSGDVFAHQKEKALPELTSKLGKQKMKKGEKTRKSLKLGLTDWDQESDHEEKSSAKKMQFASSGSQEEFPNLKKEKVDSKKERKEKKKMEKKNEIVKETKTKNSKKHGKLKKKKYESYSENDSSESNDSDSYGSDFDDSDSSGKKNNKKLSKTKKKFKKISSSESESDSDECAVKRKKSKPKKGGKKKDSNNDSDENQNSLSKQLDFKKQLVIKKIEEIDCDSDKKKQKDDRTRTKDSGSSEDTEFEKHIKSVKEKKMEVKNEKGKKKSKIKKNKLLGKTKKIRKNESSSESDSETSEEDNTRGKKSKNLEKKKRDSSEDSSSNEKGKNSTKPKSSGKSNKKSKKTRKDSSSSDSDTGDNSNVKKKRKKDEVKIDDNKLSEGNKIIFKEKLDGLDLPKPSVWERKELWKKSEKQRAKKNEDDDWEASSAAEESEKECKTRESSWDDEVSTQETVTKVTDDIGTKPDIKDDTMLKKQTSENSQEASEVVTQLSSGTLKGSLSVFSFNENSFCSFGQELSRDFFLTDLTCSNSGNLCGNENLKTNSIESRPFQSVSKDGELKKVAHSELYSPGHSDSEVSDVEISKSEKSSINFVSENKSKEKVHYPLNCDSEGSKGNNKVELSSIPLPNVSDILLPGETRNFENLSAILPFNLEGSVFKNPPHDSEKSDIKFSSMTPPLKSNFSSSDFTPVTSSQAPLSDDKNTPTKRQLMSVKGQPKLISKAASVFQDESDEENIEPSNKSKTTENAQSEPSTGETKCEVDNNSVEEKPISETGKEEKEIRSRSKERSAERRGKKKRNRSRERKSHSESSSKRGSSPRKEKKAKASGTNRERREIRSDSFEIEPLRSSMESDAFTDLVQPIPVLTGLEPSTDRLWTRSLIPEFSRASDNLIDNGESFDIYPSEESTYRSRSHEKDEISLEKLKDQRNKKESRKSRSKSQSPKPKPRSKSPEKRRSPKNRSPRRKSASPKRKEKSPFSPKRRSPKRKSPSRRHKKSSRSPDKRRKSRSRSPRKRWSSPRRSRSVSPRKYRSPKYSDESPRRRESSATAFSPSREFSPRKDTHLHPQSVNRIPVIGTSASLDDPDRELSPSRMEAPMFENSAGFPQHMPDPSFQEPDMYGSFYEGEYSEGFRMTNYPEEVSANNLITVKNHDIEKTASSERLSLDQRIELELGVPMTAGSQVQSDQYQVCPQFQDPNYFQNSCNCDNGNVSADNFYQNQSVHDFNGQYFNGHQQQSNYRPFQQYPNSQPVQNSVLQVGNIVEVVPTSQHPPPSKTTPQIMQVGNVLQVVPSQKPISQNYSDGSPIVKTQKATAVVAPSSVVSTLNPEAVLSPLIKAIQLEREKRRKEKEKRKAEREARRKARQLRREAKLMLVNEKLKKSVQNEGLMLGQEVEDDELLDGLDVPSPPIPVEIITVSSPNALPPAGKGILITAGFMPKPPSEKKEVKFADGVCPGEGTSTSGGEDIASPPPKPKLPKEKRFKKRKTKVKKKVKVQIIRQIIQEEDDDEDDLSPPPPPPGDPPPVFFARFPFAGEAQFPVYQTQTTTTTLTAVQYPNPSFE